MASKSSTEARRSHGLPGKRRRIGVTVILASIIFLSGIFVGVVGTGFIIWERVVYNIRNLDTLPDRIVTRLDQRLNLSDEQQQSITGIVDRHMATLFDLREEVQPRVTGVLHDLRDEIAAELTEEQRALFLQRFDALREEFAESGALGNGAGP